MERVPYYHRQAVDLLTACQLERIHAMALRILAEVGLAVSSAPIREQMAARGFRVSGERVYFEPSVVEEHLAERRRRQPAAKAPTSREEMVEGGQLHLTARVRGG